MEKKEHYSLRKLKFGLVSVAVAAFLIGTAGVVQADDVSKDEAQQDTVTVPSQLTDTQNSLQETPTAVSSNQSPVTPEAADNYQTDDTEAGNNVGPVQVADGESEAAVADPDSKDTSTETSQKVSDTASIPYQNTFVDDGQGNWYYLDNNGQNVTGLQTIDGKQLYFAPDGKQVKGREATIDNKVYYFDAHSGEMWVSRFHLGDDGQSWFYYGADGARVGGAQQIAGQDMYFDPETGKQAKNTFLQGDNNSWFYYGKDGVRVRGSKTIAGHIMYFDPETGKQAKGDFVQESDGKRRYYDADSGSLWTNRFLQFDNSWYYLGPDGVPVTGSQKIAGQNLYFREDGRQVKGDSVIDAEGVARYYDANSGDLVNGDTTEDDDKPQSDIKDSGNIILDGSRARTNSQSVSISDKTITITQSGTYRIKGKSDNFQILIADSVSSEVQLILDNVTMTGTNTAIISESKKARLIITLENKTNNSLSNTATDQKGAVISSPAELIINGSGSLTITAPNKAISVSSKENINKGNITITNANLIINAKGDAIHATNNLRIDKSNIDIQSSEEGIEGKVITIQDSDIKIVATDDGINAVDWTQSDKNIGGNVHSASTMNDIQMNLYNSNITINSAGDGLDSNGNVTINGGNLIVTAPSKSYGNSYDSAIDFDGIGIIRNGTVWATGTPITSQGFSEGSTQAHLKVNISGVSGDRISIVDENGNTLDSFVAQRDFQNLVYSSAKLTNGHSYGVKAGQNSVNTTAVLKDTTSYKYLG
ncbi:carbohydrate-binding domain-containing protein [Streptococcus dentapri]|uniref:Carbohydrate-binding domain-containing protein n=1 Tax=Streptococcus dentapri TaxID=573564 RepID=A0ABV8CZD6_9STRE